MDHDTLIDEDDVTFLSKGNYSLCMAKIMNQSGLTSAPGSVIPISNVVAACYIPGGAIDDLFTDVYFVTNVY